MNNSSSDEENFNLLSQSASNILMEDYEDDVSAFGDDEMGSNAGLGDGTDDDDDEQGSLMENKEDIQLMNVVRAIVILILLTVACISSETAFVLAILAEEEQYRTAYYKASQQLEQAFYGHVQHQIQLAQTLAEHIRRTERWTESLLTTPGGNDNNNNNDGNSPDWYLTTLSPWPFVTLPDFPGLVQGTQQLSRASRISLLPAVTYHEVSAFELYVAEQLDRRQDEANGLLPPPTLFDNPSAADDGGGDASPSTNGTATNVQYYTTHFPEPKVHGFFQGLATKPAVKDNPNASLFYFPQWQTSPPLDMSDGNVLALFDHSSNKVRQAALEQAPSLSGILFEDTMDQDWAIYPSPRSALYYPIFEDDDNNDQAASWDAVLELELDWTVFFQSAIDPDEYDAHLHVVLESECPNLPVSSRQTFTLNVTGPDVAYWGPGDLHEENRGFQVQSTDAQTYLDIWTSAQQQQPGNGNATVWKNASAASVCVFTASFYPSTAFADSYTSWNPDIYRVILLAAFLMVICVFLAYDGLIERRQKNVVKAAVRSDAIVRSLFPTKIRDRLYENAKKKEEEKSRASKNAFTTSFHNDASSIASSGRGAFILTPKTKLKSFVNDGEAQMPEDEPIADLFPHTSILFADISGFTAWSSEREPSQVFTLLENIYSVMDKLAKKGGVFKVETVGDCYVAATGLPEPQEQHAVIMVRFAQASLLRINQLVNSLEARLGPGTADLAMRVGIHSGPVTAGVLRGQKARFQLFGDTMNTASRMETNGQKNRIHVSSETANLLIKSGKGNWVVAREELVHAKGKGYVQTYWVKGMQASPSLGSSTADQSQMTHEQMGASAEFGTMPWEGTYMAKYFGLTPIDDGLMRLINWNTDLLFGLLKAVVVSRVAAGLPKSSKCPEEKEIATELVLDEVEMVIDLPGFDPDVAERAEDIKSQVKVNEKVKTELRDYVLTIATGYLKNPFHNFEHASHVILSANKLLKRIMSLDTHKNHDTGEAITSEDLHEHTYGIGTDPLTQFAIVFSALIHDVAHAGVPNFLLAEEDPDLADRYIQKSIAEQHSVTIAWDLLMQPHFKTLRSYLYTCEEECERFRKLLVNMVISTDIFDPDLKALRTSRWDLAFDQKEAASESNSVQNINRRATIVIEHVIQASDVSHTMQHWYIYQKWNERLFEEMYRAFLSDRSKKDPSLGWYDGELWFFDNYVIPLATKLKKCGVFGYSSDEYLNYATQNRQEWYHKGHDVVEAMKERVLGKADGDIPRTITGGSSHSNAPKASTHGHQSVSKLDSVPEMDEPSSLHHDDDDLVSFASDFDDQSGHNPHEKHASSSDDSDSDVIAPPQVYSEDDLPPNQRIVIAPEGTLGVVIDSTPGEATLIHKVMRTSPLKGKVKAGEEIVAIDGVYTRQMSTEAIGSLLRASADHPRRFVVQSRVE